MSVAAVFFDLDGTLIDTAPDFYAGIQRLRALRQEPAVAYEVIRQAVSSGSKAVLLAAYPDLDEDRRELLRLQFLDDYEAHIADFSRIFDGLESALATLELRGIPWGIITNKPTRFTHPLLRALGLDQRVAAVVCADEVRRTKPDAEPMLLACQRAQVDPAQCWYVGDHLRDIQAGHAAHMRTVSAGWGYIDAHDDPRAWQASVHCQHVDDFSAWLNTVID